MATIEQQQPSPRGGIGPAPLQPPSPEISPIRVAMLLVVLAALAFGVWRLLNGGTSAADARSDAAPVYEPYVDVTQTPIYPFQLPSANPVAGVYLAFVVSDPSQPCTPSWGAYYTLEQAEQSLDLGARTAQLRNQGGSVMISYGGRDNSELAVGCTDPSKLLQAYLAPIERYHASAIDLDLEGQTLANAAADARRAQAIAAVQRRMAARHTSLAVWVTLPVSRAGLTGEGIAAVRSLLAAHVELAGVNAMTMDFGPDEGAAQRHARHGRARALRDPRAGAVALAQSRARERRRGSLGPCRRDGDARCQRRHRSALHHRRRPRARHVRQRPRDSAGLGVVAQPRLRVRRRVPPDRGQLQHLQRRPAELAAVHPHLRLAEGHEDRAPAERSEHLGRAATRTGRDRRSGRRAPTRSGARRPPTAAATRSSGRAKSTKRAGGPREPRRAPRRRTRPTGPGS